MRFKVARQTREDGSVQETYTHADDDGLLYYTDQQGTVRRCILCGAEGPLTGEPVGRLTYRIVGEDMAVAGTGKLVHTEPGGCDRGVIVYTDDPREWAQVRVRCLMCGAEGQLGEKVEIASDGE